MHRLYAPIIIALTCVAITSPTQALTVTIDSSWLLAGESDWTIAGNTLNCSGASNNQSIQKNVPVSNGHYYKIEMELLQYSSGALFVSRWGFVGVDNGFEITQGWTSGMSGKFHFYVICQDATKPLRFTSNQFNGAFSVQITLFDITFFPTPDREPRETYQLQPNSPQTLTGGKK